MQNIILAHLTLLFVVFSSNVVYYPLAQQSTLQQPVFITSTTGGTATAWPTNIFSQYNLANLSAAAGTTSSTNLAATLANPGTLSASQTIFDGTTALFDSTSATGQQLHWPNYNQL